MMDINCAEFGELVMETANMFHAQSEKTEKTFPLLVGSLRQIDRLMSRVPGLVPAYYKFAFGSHLLLSKLLERIFENHPNKEVIKACAAEMANTYRDCATLWRGEDFEEDRQNALHRFRLGLAYCYVCYTSV